MKTIRIDYVDFWDEFSKDSFLFTKLLKEKFNVIIDTANPDFIFYSVFGEQHKKYNCKKIFYTGENIAPDLDYCDFAFTFDHINHPKHYRLPIYVFEQKYYNLVNKNIELLSRNPINRKFCNFIYSNGNSAPYRDDFFHKLSKYKKVDSLGKHLNNIGCCAENKERVQRQYKFTIAMENQAHRNFHSGYTTEKIIDAMWANSMPIYAGNPDVHLDFNEKSFINAANFDNNMDDIIDYIITLDQDDDLYLQKLKEPWLIDNKIPEEFKMENIKAQLFQLFE